MAFPLRTWGLQCLDLIRTASFCWKKHGQAAMPKHDEKVPHVGEEAEGKGLGNPYPPWTQGDDVGDLERAGCPGQQGHGKADGSEHHQLQARPAREHHTEWKGPEEEARCEDFEGGDEYLE